MNIEKQVFNYERMRGTSWLFLFYSFIYAAAFASTTATIVMVLSNFANFMSGTMEQVPDVSKMTFGLSMAMLIPYFLVTKKLITKYKWLSIFMGCFFTFMLSLMIAGGIVGAAGMDNFYVSAGMGIMLASIFMKYSYEYHKRAFEELQLW